MKKILGIIVLSFLLGENAYANNGYLLEDNLFTNCDILTKKDPTSFDKISFVEEKRIKWWDRRKEKISAWEQSYFNAFVFKATFEKGHEIKIRVNSEFKNREEAEKQALKFVLMIGQLPNFLRSKNLRTITIHKGDHDWGGGNYDILIHTGSKLGVCEEEVIMHESGHTSLDWDWGGSVNSSQWKKAAKADSKFISEYAKQYPDSEDVAETINWWIAVRCKPDKLSNSTYKKIVEGIPNRLRYLDKQNYDTYPLECN